VLTAGVGDGRGVIVGSAMNRNDCLDENRVGLYSNHDIDGAAEGRTHIKSTAGESNQLLATAPRGVEIEPEAAREGRHVASPHAFPGPSFSRPTAYPPPAPEGYNPHPPARPPARRRIPAASVL
jgi:hypothetical protein